MEGAAGPIAVYLEALVAELRGLEGGAPATYIPELGKADPRHFGIALATVDGTVYTAGDARIPFTIQSVSKPFVYAHALDRLGRAEVLAHVGVEPTGESFNAITLDEANNRPFNPMVNSGAIATSELIAGDTAETQRAAMHDLFARFAGRELPLDDAVYGSEKATGHRNRAIAWMMFNQRMITHEPEDVLDLYFRQCSLLVDAHDLAVMGATLANEGVNPLTGQRAMKRRHVPDVLTVMTMCGMYNYAGQWTYEIGLPAKSGVSGAIMLVVPGQAGIAIYSPAIDARGNSVRGIAACRRIAEDFGLHIFATHPSSRTVIRHAYRGAQLRSKRSRSPADEKLLRRSGSYVRVFELQDALYFGSVERLLRRARASASTATWLILDLRRVSSADVAARRLLIEFRAELAAQGKHLLFTHLRDHPVLGELCRDVSEVAPDAVFADRDAALEHAENHLLGAAAKAPPRVAFDALELVEGMSADEIALLHGIATPISIAAGEHLARERQPSDTIFAIGAGRASIRLGSVGERRPRLGSVGPGMMVGELGLVDPGPRAADIVADEAVEGWSFAIPAIHALGKAHPAVLARLLTNVGRGLAERLREANEEIRALEA